MSELKILQHVYVAGWFNNQVKVREMQEALRKRGFTITHDWTAHEEADEDDDELKQKYAICDINGVRKSDFIVALWPAKTGTKIEIGAALGCRIPVVLIGNVDNNQEGLLGHIFYQHPLIVHYLTVEDFLSDLDENRWP